MNMRIKILILPFILLALASCQPAGNTSRLDSNSSNTTDLSKKHQISLIEVSSNQLILNGTNLNTVSAVKTKYGPQVINLNILSKTANMVRLSIPNGMKLVAGYLYDLVVTDAFGQSTTTISFDVQDDSISTSKIQDGSITNSKLGSLGATTAGQLLQYDGADWVAVDYVGGNNYLGRIVLAPSGSVLPLSTSGFNNGDFYVINDASAVVGDVNDPAGVGAITYNPGDIIRLNTALSTPEWELQSSGTSYVGPWSVSGSNIRRVSSNKVTIHNTAYDGPAMFNVGTDSAASATIEDSSLISIAGNVASGAGQWSRAMSFGLRDERYATMGVMGSNSGFGTAGDYFYIDVDGAGSPSGTPWLNADFYIAMNGYTYLGMIPDGSSYRLNVNGDTRIHDDLDVDGNIVASSFTGDGSGITNVNATNMTNSSTMTLQGGTSGSGNIAFQSNTSDFAVFDSQGYLSFGHNNANSTDYTATAQIDVRSNSEDVVGQFYSYDGNQSSINLGSSQGLTTGPVATATGDSLGSINFGGDNSTGIVSSSNITSRATENFAAGNLGSELAFSTTPNTTNTPVESMKLSHDGRLLVGVPALSDTSANSLVVGGDTLLDGDMRNTGLSTFFNIDLGGTFTQTGGGVVSLDGPLTSTNNITGANVTSTGGMTNTGVLQNFGNANVIGDLEVTGTTTFNGNINLNGDIALQNLTVNTIGGNTSSSTASFGTITAVSKLIGVGDSNNSILKGGSANNFEVNLGPTEIKVGNVNTGGTVTTAIPLALYTNDTARLHISTAGDVGIGTTTPTQALDVNGNITATQLCIGTDCRSVWPDTLTDIADGVTIEENGANKLQVVAGSIQNSHLASGIDASKITTGAINDSLLGPTVSKLGQTIESSEITDATIVNADINAAAQIAWSKINNSGVITNANIHPTAAIDYAKLNIADGAIPYAKLSVADGDIPYAKLTVADGDIPYAKLTVADGDIPYAKLTVADGDIAWTKLDTSVDVGIGTSSPTEKLHVVGNLRVEGTTDCTLGDGAGATNCTSDRRLKDNIENIPNALDKIKSLNGVSFDWNEKSIAPGKHSIGVIAQDVQAQFPTAVIENSEGWLAVDYAVLVSPLIEAVKELDKNLEMYKLMSEGVEQKVEANTRAIASLKEENTALKTQVNKLKEDNAQMKEALCSMNSSFKFCQ